MNANKIELNGEVLLDLTQDTVTEADVAEGKTFHLADGTPATGTQTPVTTQEKSVDITENGTTEVLPDAGYALSKVIINALVESGGSGGLKYASKYVTTTGVWGERVSAAFGFKPDIIVLAPASNLSCATTNKILYFGSSAKFAEAAGCSSFQHFWYIYSSKFTLTSVGTPIDVTDDQNAPIYAADETGFNIGKTAMAGKWFAYAIGI